MSCGDLTPRKTLLQARSMRHRPARANRVIQRSFRWVMQKGDCMNGRHLLRNTEGRRPLAGAPCVQRNSRFIAPNRLLGPTSCRTMFGLLLVAGAAGWAGGFLDDLSIGFVLSRRPKVVELFVISQPQTCAARSPSQMPLRRVSSWPSPPSWRVRWLPSLCWLCPCHVGVRRCDRRKARSTSQV